MSKDLYYRGLEEDNLSCSLCFPTQSCYVPCTASTFYFTSSPIHFLPIFTNLVALSLSLLLFYCHLFFLSKMELSSVRIWCITPLQTPFPPDLAHLHVILECLSGSTVQGCHQIQKSSCTAEESKQMTANENTEKWNIMYLEVMLPNCCVLMVKVCCNQSIGLLGETHTKQTIGAQHMWGNVEMEPIICQEEDWFSFSLYPTVN